jgi:anthranilate phosphoribosyltransferase
MAPPPNLLQESLRRVVEARATLSRAEATALLESVLRNSDRSHDADVQLAALLGALGARGETAEEIAGFAIAMRGAALRIPLNQAEQAELVDTCGTGGDASGTFNISTAAALVAAAAGAKVAKHGNRAITSRSGSADVLEALGIPTNLTPAQAASSIADHGFCFLMAPAHHPAMAKFLPVRRALGVRTVLHVLGPLLNPAGARRQVMGVYSPRLVPLVAEAMIMLNVDHAFVVHGDSGLDELALSGPSEVAEIRDGKVRQYTVAPEDFGLARAPVTALASGDAAESAATLIAVFAGQRGPHRDVVVLNAAAVLAAAGVAADIRAGVELAQHTLDSGAVSQLRAALR